MSSTAYPFSVGAAYRTRQAQSPEDYLATVYAAERFIAEHQHEDADGVYWDNPEGIKHRLSLYSGDSGLAYFYLELAKATNQERFTSIAHRAALHIAKHWRDIVEDPPIRTPFDLTRLSYFGGVSGVGSTLILLYREFPDQQIATAIQEIGQYLLERSHVNGTITYWSGSGTLLFDGGIVLFLQQLYETFHDDKVRQLLIASADYLLSTGVERPSGSLDFDQPAHQGATFKRPCYELGTGGIALALAKAYESTHAARYLDAAKRAIQYLYEIRVPQRKGSLLPLRIEADGTLFKGNSDSNDPLGDNSTNNGDLETRYDEPLFYVACCHGPAGTSRALYELYTLTSDQFYLDFIRELSDGLISIGGLERQSAGLWNSVDYCCGEAGIAHFYTALYALDHSPEWRDHAIQAASILLGEREDRADGSADWPVAWQRIVWKKLIRSIGYYDGAAGIASSLLQVYLTLTDRYHWDRLADDPFPEQ